MTSIKFHPTAPRQPLWTECGTNCRILKGIAVKTRLMSLLLSSLIPVSAAGASPALPTVVARIALHDGGWDTLTVDPASRRVLIARSDGVDARTGKVLENKAEGANPD